MATQRRSRLRSATLMLPWGAPRLGRWTLASRALATERVVRCRILVRLDQDQHKHTYEQERNRLTGHFAQHGHNRRRMPGVPRRTSHATSMDLRSEVPPRCVLAAIRSGRACPLGGRVAAP